MAKYHSCGMINQLAMNFNGRIDTGEKCMTLCCEGTLDMPGIALQKDKRELLTGFINLRDDLIRASKRTNEQTNKRTNEQTNKCLFDCPKCANWQLGDWQNDGLIHYVNLSMYPAPCQCKCFYCGVGSDYSGKLTTAAGEYYEMMFDLLEYGQEKSLIAPDAIWQVSSGEITIHPYKKRIINLVRGQRAAFYTNCFMFDEDIAANLHDNANSAINLSIDAGTPKTWNKVKGVDNFSTVVENLAKYRNVSRPGQITMKYIVFPEVNANLRDYKGVAEIMKFLEVRHLTLARDARLKYTIGTQDREMLIEAAGYLAAILHKNGMSMDMFSYAPEERELIAGAASELLRSGRV